MTLDDLRDAITEGERFVVMRAMDSHPALFSKLTNDDVQAIFNIDDQALLACLAKFDRLYSMENSDYWCWKLYRSGCFISQALVQIFDFLVFRI